MFQVGCVKNIRSNYVTIIKSVIFDLYTTLFVFKSEKYFVFLKCIVKLVILEIFNIENVKRLSF